MASHTTTEGLYGPGSFVDDEFIPVPVDARRILEHMVATTPGFPTDPQLRKEVHFHGNDLSIIPGPGKPQAFGAVLHAMAGMLGKAICAARGIETGKISIDTDHAAFFPATPSFVSINGKGMPQMAMENTAWHTGTDLDHGVFTENPLNYRAWAIYPTRTTDGKNVYYQVLANTHPTEFLKVYGVDPDLKLSSREEAYELLKGVFGKYSARELEMINMEQGFCGQTCLSPLAWRDTLMGKSLAKHPIINSSRMPETYDLPPVPWPIVSGDSRPLAGIKIVEMARIIAAPVTGQILSSLGAEVVKVESPNLPDPNALQMSLTAGKYTCPIDLNKEEDKQKLWALLADADVVLQAYRRRSVERRGFGLNDVLAMANKRGKGIVYMDMTCYGPDGYYAERPGYQQCADAASGYSFVCGKAYGHDEGVAVLPPLPIADMLSGVAGAVGVMIALRDRAEKGGSYHVDACLTAVDAVQMTKEFGLYSPETVQKCQDLCKFGPMTPDQHVEEILRVVGTGWQNTETMHRKDIWAHFDETPFGKDHKILAPIIKYENKEATPHWTHGPVPYCHNEEVKWST